MPVFMVKKRKLENGTSFKRYLILAFGYCYYGQQEFLMIKTLMCKLGLHDWAEWVKWKWSSYQAPAQWEMQECKHCGIRRYKVIK